MMKVKLVRNIDDFVKAMGGTGACARWLEVGDAYVSNMLARGYLPGGFHMQAMLEMKRRGIKVDPAFFELKGDDAELFKKLEVRTRRPLARRRRTEQRPAA